MVLIGLRIDTKREPPVRRPTPRWSGETGTQATEMTRARLRTGRIGEDRACEFLVGRGFAIIARNCRTRFGEIDAIALDRGALVFVEVKTMRQGSRSGPERPVLAERRGKHKKNRRLPP